MALPDFASFLLPVLNAFADGEIHSIHEIRERVAQQFCLSQEDRELKLRNTRTPVYANRCAWAVIYLTEARALERTARGVYRITTHGLEVLARSSGRITLQDLLREPGMLSSSKSNSHSDAIVTSEQVTPIERFEIAYSELRTSLQAELMENVRSLSPSRFEQLVLDLLSAMGYGGAVEDAVRAVGRAGDEGIDGVIKEDKLGLDVVYVQAKRWQQNIGRPEVQAFVGALAGKKARKGVFITTSDFTKEAREYVQSIDHKIVLIDGRQLAELMIDHDVGVTVVQTYKLKRVDSDYFESE